jgi:hypothetical protein
VSKYLLADPALAANLVSTRTIGIVRQIAATFQALSKHRCSHLERTTPRRFFANVLVASALLRQKKKLLGLPVVDNKRDSASLLSTKTVMVIIDASLTRSPLQIVTEAARWKLMAMLHNQTISVERQELE